MSKNHASTCTDSEETAAKGQDLGSAIEQAIATLDLPSKVKLLSGARMFSLSDEPSIGLREIVMSDGPSGVRGPLVVGGRVACLLPNATLIAQSWDLDVMREVGQILADEAEDQETHVVLGPTVNLHRTPLGGRLFECFSEDPVLTGHLGAAYVQSLQERGIAATPKHFLANEAETERTTVDSVVPEDALRELYLLPFQIMVEDARPWTIMASYNKINGTTATEHDELLNKVLKDEWGFDGLVISDWLATKTAVESANGGLDLVMPGPDTPWSRSLVAAVQNGDVSEDTIDDHLRRLLRLASRVGAFDGGRNWAKDLPRPDGPERREQLRRLAARSMAVLVNRDNTLPLRKDSTERVVVIGRHAIDTVAQGGGSAIVRPPHVVSAATGIARALGEDRVTVVDGVQTRTQWLAANPELLRDPETGTRGARARIFDKQGNLLGTRHLEVPELEVSGESWASGAASIELSAELALDKPARMMIGTRGAGNWDITAPGYRESVRTPFHNGPGGGFFRPKSHAAPLDLEPGARITATTDAEDENRLIGLVAEPALKNSAAAIRDAVAAAADADVAVVVVGYTQEQETEGQDKNTLALPGDQDALVAAVAAVARRTVVVLNAGTPVLMPWIADVDAVLFAGLPGQEAGDAIAAALTGDVEPAGRLVTTFPARDGQGPAWSVTPRGGKLPYSEGTGVGYRGWSTSAEQPLFWFGHGLGYTEWDYKAAEITTMEREAVKSVRVTLRNAGDRAGTETVQLYRFPDDPSVPPRLIGWAQLHLKPGGQASIDVSCDPRAQRLWNSTARRWDDITGGRIVVARGLGDVRLELAPTGREAMAAGTSKE
ncbi:MAG TPA: glycoside hydrolase family 3 C-terminal domain-containing protein [Arthrobacter sp.]